MAKLTSAALAAHELGLAATFGGIVFGQTGLTSSASVISDANERTRVMEKAWRTFAVPKTVGLLTTAATWLIGRSVFSGRALGRDLRRLILAKDVALGVTLAAGLGAQLAGRSIAREAPFPTDADGEPGPGATDRARTLVHTVSWLGALQMVAAGTALALTSALNLRGHQSTRWGLVARLLP